MAIVKITFPSGKTEKKKLSRRSPFSIGSNSANDFTIEDDNIASIECRISWNKTNYEVTAATDEPVIVNGANVKNTLLRTDDIITVGEYEFKFVRGKPAKSKRPGSDKKEEKTNNPESVGLKPLTEDENLEIRKDSSDKPDKEKPKKKNKDNPVDLTGDLLGDILEEENKDLNKKKRKNQEREEEDDAFADALMIPRTPSSKSKKKASSNEESLLEGIQSRIQTRSVRPGEQEMLRSPLILSLGVGTIVLALAGLTFWFVIGRNTSDAHYLKASNFRSEKKYAQSIESFHGFIQNFPRDSRVDQAKMELGKCLIEKEINTSVPVWNKGVDALNLFISNNRDLPDYGAQSEELKEYAEKIAFGAAETSTRTKDAKYLEYSKAAQKIALRFIKDKALKTEFKNKLDIEVKKAVAAILKKGVFDEHFEEMDKNLNESNTLAAVKTWELLLRRYPDFKTNPKIKEVKNRILKTELSSVKRNEDKKPAKNKDKDNSLPKVLSLTVHRRSRTGARSENRTVVSLAKDCCIGIDTITGKPRWRRVIGMDTPFFPIPADSSGNHILIFDTRSNELINLEKESGKLAWRQSINSSVPGEPLLHEGQIYLSTSNKKLFQIDVETGEILSVLNFNQGVHGPPVLDASNKKIILAGDSSFIYSLSIRPLKCELVSYTGQLKGTIKTPLLRMGSLILVIENNNPDQSLLRVFDTKNSASLIQVASHTIQGEVLNRPVLRGSKLFITSTGHRISAFNVSDDPNQKTLVPLSDIEVTGNTKGPLHLIAGSDNRLWLASNALREFRLNSETIQVEKNSATIGLSSQPIQIFGESFYIGRKPFYSQSTLFTEVDRAKMTEKWQLTLGASILKQVSSGQNSLLCGTENGDFYNLKIDTISKPGFRISPTTPLKIPRNLTKNIQMTVLKSNKVVVYIDQPSPHVWIITPSGQIENELNLKSGIQAPPVEFAKGVLLPIAGKIHYWNPNPVKDYFTVVDQKTKLTWKSLTPVNNTHFIALDSNNNLHRISLQSGPTPSLQKITQVSLETHVDLPLKSEGSDLFLVNASNELVRLNNSSLEIIESQPLSGKKTLNFWKKGNRILLETISDQKHILEAWSFSSQGLKKEWMSDLPSGHLVGIPVVYEGSLILAHKNGMISQLSLKDHQTKNIGTVPQPITCAPSVVDKKIIVCTIDGSLQIVNSFLNSNK